MAGPGVLFRNVVRTCIVESPKLQVYNSGYARLPMKRLIGVGVGEVFVARGISAQHAVDTLWNRTLWNRVRLSVSARMNLFRLKLSEKQGQWGLRGKKQTSTDGQGATKGEGNGSTGRSSGSQGGSKRSGNNEWFNPSPRKMGPRDLLIPAGLLMLLSYLSNSQQSSRSVRDVSMQYFLNKMLAVGEVDRIEVDTDSETVYVTLHSNAVVDDFPGTPSRFLYRVSIGSVATFERQIEEFQRELGLDEKDFISIRYQTPGGVGDIIGEVVVAVLPFLVFGAVFFAMTRRLGGMKGPGSGGAAGGPPGSSNPFSMGKISVEAAAPSTTRFTDVAGLGEAKVEVMEFVDYLRNPERFETLGAKVPKGAMLTGPPGTGKTLLAKAVAGEAKVPFYSVSGSDFVEMFVGVGASRVRDLFKKARQNKPSIVYIDEIDAVGKARKSSGSGGSNQEREQTLNQLLVEMDGFATESGIVVLASTNRVDTLDKALLRPGRFDRQIACDLPTLEERKEIFAIHLEKLVVKEAKEGYIPQLAALSPGMSGAQIANICNEAALFAARRGASAVDWEDFMDAADRVIAGPEKRSRTMAANEKAVVAYHESGHVLTAWLLETMDPLLKTTIVPRTTGALGFAQYLPTDKALHSQQELEDRLVVMLGGRAAEQVQFGSITTGASDDLKRVSEIAYAMLTQYGMSKKIGNLAWPDFPKPDIGYRRASNALTEIVEREADQIVKNAYGRAVAILTENKHKLQQIAENLLTRETLHYDDIVDLIGPRPFEHKHPYRFDSIENKAGSTHETESSVDAIPTPLTIQKI